MGLVLGGIGSVDFGWNAGSTGSVSTVAFGGNAGSTGSVSFDCKRLSAMLWVFAEGMGISCVCVRAQEQRS